MTAHTFLAGILLALASLLVFLPLLAGLRARKKGLASGPSLVAEALALLVCGGSITALVAGWVGRSTSLTDLDFAVLLLTMAMGWAMLRWISDSRRTTAAAQIEAAAHQARHLEQLVQERNAELSARLQDLEEARRTAEVANKGLQRALDQLEQVASIDQLTGAWNRRRFEEAVLSEIALAHRRRDPLALIMFDLDHFKRVNDTFGHGAGDVVLASTAQTVRQQLRLSDALIRWGGEEFLVMAPATRLEGALGLAEKLRAAVAAIDYPTIGQVTMSLGVSEYALGEGLEEWIARTDQALYQAKAQGRNRVVAAPTPVRPGELPQDGRSLVEMIWEDSYTSGHPLLDTQHRRLFHLASSLLSVLAEKRPVDEVSLRLQTLLAHTAQHFHDEEALLREAHYPDAAMHAAIHTELLNKAGEFQEDVQSGHLDFGKLVNFLTKDLVKDHILTEDQNYFAHLRILDSPGDASPA
jgi:diguanylate cyclase (GGDEF)-like protein/hemerythrin-like metal-binding protein